MKQPNQFRKDNVNINFVAKKDSEAARALELLMESGKGKNTIIKEALCFYAKNKPAL